jgi:hypothetical protein
MLNLGKFDYKEIISLIGRVVQRDLAIILHKKIMKKTLSNALKTMKGSHNCAE